MMVSFCAVLFPTDEILNLIGPVSEVFLPTLAYLPILYLMNASSILALENTPLFSSGLAYSLRKSWDK